MTMEKVTCIKYLCTLLVNFVVYSSSQHMSLIDISTSQGSILQCNVKCVSNPQCTAFTLQRKNGESSRSSLNMCKLHRFKNPNDSEESISIPDKNDVIMIMKRENSNIFQSNVIDYSRLIAPSEEFSTAVLLESERPLTTKLSTEETTSKKSAETKSPVTTELSISAAETKGPVTTELLTKETTSTTGAETTVEILPINETPTALKSTEVSQTLPTQSTTMTSTNLPTSTTTILTSTEHPTTQTLVLQDSFQFTAMDEIGNDKYIFYWTDMSGFKKRKPRFSVVNKNNLKINLQEGDISDVFESFIANDLYSAFTVDGVSYFLTMNALGKTNWIKYRMEFNNEGLISKAVKLSGTISNPAANLEPMPRCTTVIGNDTILIKGESKFRAPQGICFHKSLIDGTQITSPPPNKECVEILKILMDDPEVSKASSILGHDKSTLRVLLDQTKMHQL